MFYDLLNNIMSTSEACTDVVELCALLQCLGFSVKSLDTSDGNISQSQEPAGGARTVVINCQTSGIHVVLESASLSCSCPAPSHQNSGVWQVSGVTGGKHLDKEFGCNILGSLPKAQRERLNIQLRDIIRCIKEQNDDQPEDRPAKEDKSASMTDLKTPDKLLANLKADTPTRYRSLDTLTAAKNTELPEPRPLKREKLISECEDRSDAQKMVRRQSTYTLGSTPGSVRRRNKTSSPIQMTQNNLIDRLLAAEQMAEELRYKLSEVIREVTDNKNDDSSMSSLALDVSKISVLKSSDTPKAQFSSSPNLFGTSAHEGIAKTRLKRFDSASTSNLLSKSGPNDKKTSRLRLISPRLFKSNKATPTAKDNLKSQDGKSKLQGLFKPKIVTPVRIPKSVSTPEPSPSLSSSARKKFSHVKSTIPRPSK